MSTYSIEESKSSRAKCKKCGQVIAKGELRIGTHNEVDDKTFTSWNHVSCYQMTKRLKAEYSTNQNFLSEAVQDDTNDKILGTAEGIDEIAAVMGTKQVVKHKGEKKRKHEQDDDSMESSSSNVLFVIKQNALTLGHHDDDDDDGDKQEEKDEEENETSESNKHKKKKKLKLSPTEEKQVQVYEKYAQCKVDDLKDMLRWNKVPRTGTKDVLLLRLIDGEVYGRLGKCPICGKGQLKLNDEGTDVQCKGFYNEDVGGFEVCYFSINPEKAPRLPWFDHEPSEQEQEEMMRQDANERTTETGSSAAVLPPGFLQTLKREMEWDVSTKEGMKQTSLELSKILLSDDSPIAIPSNTDTSKVRMEVGKIMLQNKDKSMEDILELISQKYGLKESKEKDSKIKEEMTASICHVKANGKICNLFRDLAAVYSAEGNRHAANAYRKVVSVITELDFEITVENAKGLGSGKNKIQGIGKKSAEYMQEFLETGTLQKLEEKKAGMM